MDKVSEEIIYKIALSMTPGITPGVVNRIVEVGMSPEEFFESDTQSLGNRLGLNRGFMFQKTDREEALMRARKEYDFVTRKHINVHFILDDTYPVLLAETPNAPVVIYQYGSTDLNNEKALAIVGTRTPTPYGVEWCREFVRNLSGYFPDMMIVSGLAYGIDATAHSSSIENALPTVGVVAHGLDTIYPSMHRSLAYEMVMKGGCLVSEYPSGFRTQRSSFLARNRIIAGMSVVTVVVESEVKGGAMNTASTAFSYNRDVMALPGRANDIKSGGCNLLIRRQRAQLILSAADVVESVNWLPTNIPVKIQPKDRNLFPNLSPEAGRLLEFLKSQSAAVHVDVVAHKLGMPIREIISLVTDMESDGLIIKYPGNRIESNYR